MGEKRAGKSFSARVEEGGGKKDKRKEKKKAGRGWGGDRDQEETISRCGEGGEREGGSRVGYRDRPKCADVGCAMGGGSGGGGEERADDGGGRGGRVGGGGR